jgi:hypothetical protein
MGHVDSMNACQAGSGGTSRAGAGPSGSMRAGTVGKGSRIRTSRASSRLVRCLARARTSTRFAFREVRAKHEQAREVELARAERVEQRGEPSDETSGSNAAKGFVLGEAELVNAVGVEARTGARAVNAAGFGLAEVDEELGEQLVGATHEPASPLEELGVRQLLEPRSETRNGRIDRCIRLHASHDNPAF